FRVGKMSCADRRDDRTFKLKKRIKLLLGDSPTHEIEEPVTLQRKLEFALKVDCFQRFVFAGKGCGILGNVVVRISVLLPVVNIGRVASEKNECAMRIFPNNPRSYRGDSQRKHFSLA